MATILAMGAMAGGTALSAYSTIQGGNEAAETGKIQQQQFNAEADAKVAEGLEAGGAKRREGREILATQIAQKMGRLVGDSLIIAVETVRKVEMDAITIGRNTDIEAQSLRNRGAWARYQGQLARRNARMRATADVLGSAGQMYMMKGSGSGSKKVGWARADAADAGSGAREAAANKSSFTK